MLGKINKSNILNVFRKQALNNEVYSQYIRLLGVCVEDITEVEDIPYIPIEFFKSHEVILKNAITHKIFTSSGTTGSVVSRHLVSDIDVYKESYMNGFNKFYGNIEDYTILALLPSYIEREGSSLIYMVDDLIKRSNKPNSGFYGKNFDQLHEILISLEKNNKKTLLIGVSFALLDFCELYKVKLKNTLVMETGGMKGRRKEMVREELHGLLKEGFGVENIHSEYGMTELLSQAYSKGDGIFYPSDYMQVSIRDTQDPLSLVGHNTTGGINIIDLANVNSCSFIATQDLGKTYEDGSFEVLGRFDNSDIRGCNLLNISK
ncbi:MAG: acyl transferase [Flavobacteriaceae bacterium]|nr:acyl transferase [Flavobacteriaceae bacterium]